MPNCIPETRYQIPDTKYQIPCVQMPDAIYTARTRIMHACMHVCSDTDTQDIERERQRERHTHTERYTDTQRHSHRDTEPRQDMRKVYETAMI